MNLLQNMTDQQKIASSFNQAATTYDQYAVLQKEVAKRLLQNVAILKMKPHCVLDIGCSTGNTTRLLEKHYKRATIVGVDLAEQMLRIATQKKPWFSREHFICGDASFLPLKDNSVDVLFSNLTIQWCPDLLMTFCEFFRVLKPGGALFFSTLGPDTLKELRASWQQVDGFTHVNTFKDMHDVGDLLLHARFADPIIDREDITMTYKVLTDLFHDLKYTGAHTVLGKRQHGLFGKKKFHSLIKAYQQFQINDSLFPATYEIIYGHAIKPCLIPLKSKPLREPFYIPVSAIGRNPAGV